MKARLIASAVLAATIIAGTAGCNMIAPQATTKHYDPSDGVSTNIGELQIRNILIVAGNDKGTLAMTVVNNGDTDTSIEVTVDGVDVTVLAPAYASTAFGGSEVPGVLIDPMTVPDGATTEVDFQYGTETATTVMVPVLDGLLPEYADLVPAGTTPTPRATPAEHDSGH